MFRFRLGKQTTGSDLVTATPSAGTYSTSLTAGKFYRVNFTKSDTELIYTYVGDTPVNGFKELSGALTFDRLCLSGTDLKIQNILGAGFTDVSCFELAWNAPLVNEPIGWDDLKIKLQRDKELNGLVALYTTDLTFWGDGFTYLNSALTTDGYCTQVPILIEERCSENDEWITFFEGSLNLAEAEWNLDECTAKAPIKDRGAVQTISRGKNIKVPFNEGASLYLAGNFIIDEFQSKTINMHDAAGTRPGGFYDIVGNTVFGNFKYIITQISEGNIAFDSDYFSTGDFQFLMIVPTIFLDRSITTTEDFQMSFDDVLRELDKMHNLTFAIEYNGSIPTLRVEPKSYFENATPALTLINVPNIKYKIDQDNLYRTVSVGNKAIIRDGYLEKDNEGVQYFSDFGCAGKDLNLLSKWIVDSDIIHEILIHASAGGGIDGQELFGDIFLIECEETPSSSTQVDSKIVTPGNGYNELHTPEIYMERRIDSLNADIYYSSDRRNSIVSQLSSPSFKEYEFNYPLTKAQFDSITTPGQTITFSGAGLATPSNGYILEAEYAKKTGLAKFKLLGS